MDIGMGGQKNKWPSVTVAMPCLEDLAKFDANDLTDLRDHGQLYVVPVLEVRCTHDNVDITAIFNDEGNAETGYSTQSVFLACEVWVCRHSHSLRCVCSRLSTAASTIGA